MSAVQKNAKDKVKLGDLRLIDGKLSGEVVALHKNGSVRVRLKDGREADGWPERTKPICNTQHNGPSDDAVVENGGAA